MNSEKPKTFCGSVLWCNTNIEISNIFYKIVKVNKTNTKEKK